MKNVTTRVTAMRNLNARTFYTIRHVNANMDTNGIKKEKNVWDKTITV
jgi:hypothetical protein